jgi:hypothetical protein
MDQEETLAREVGTILGEAIVEGMRPAFDAIKALEARIAALEKGEYPQTPLSAGDQERLCPECKTELHYVWGFGHDEEGRHGADLYQCPKCRTVVVD